MNEVLNFVNEKTKVLLIVRENQLEIEGKIYVHLISKK